MKALKYLAIISLLSWSCSSEIEPQVQDIEEEELECKYSINVNGFEYLLEGAEVQWSPSIGHLELGPEKPPCCQGTQVCPGSTASPVGSLWMDVNPNVDWEHFNEDTVIDTSSLGLFIFNFYSVRYWCEDLGNQEANWYSLKGENPYEWFSDGSTTPKFEIRFDGGLVMIRIEGLRISMTRDILNEADVPEDIELLVNFTALEICD